MISFLQVENLSKRFGEQLLFENITFGIGKNQKVALIAKNGMGKSTLLRIIAGKDSADTGSVIFRNDISIGILDQDPELNPENYVFEEVFNSENPTLKLIKTYEQAVKDNDASALEELIPQMDALAAWDYDTQVKQILSELKVDKYSQRIKELSGGQRKRVGLAKILISNPDFLILDEPTNHLDVEMTEWLEEYLEKTNATLLMVTHDRYFLDRVATRIVEVDQGKLYSYPGNYSEFVKLKAERQDMALATERKRKSLLRTELEWLGRGARARSTKQKAHIDRIKAMQEIKDIQEEKKVVLDSVASRMGNKTIELQNISKSYGARKLIDDYSYIFLKNDRIGIIGPNGCGKTTLLKIINGIVKPDNGTIEIGQTIRIGYFSQENEYMDASMKVIDYVKEVGEYVTTSDGKITASQMLERFLFDGAMQWSKIEKLSGGEKRRLYLMRVLMSAPNVLILDEPTNDLDIQTLTILEDYLDHFDGIIITVSHDRYFLDRIVNRIFSFEGDGKVRQFEGGYSDYLIRKELEGLDTEMSLKGHAAGTEEQPKKAESSSKDTWKQREPKLKFTFKEQREFESIDDDIAKLEEKIETLDAQIAANATNSVKLRELMEKKEETENALDEKMDRWVYLNDLNEKIQDAKQQG